MRLRELYLVETTEEDRAIISLSSSLSDYVQKYRPGDIVNLGKIGDFLDTPLEGLNDISIEILPQDQLFAKIHGADAEEAYPAQGNPMGCWFPEEKTIRLNSDKIQAKGMKSIISHELRHVLDDVKSDFRSTKSSKYFTPKNKSLRSGSGDSYTDHAAYLAQPAEINARFVQVLNIMVKVIDVAVRKISPENRDRYIMRKLDEYMNHYHISELFPEKEQSKDYKRLMKRAADFIQKELAHLTSGT
jgi:hypothetical protein